MKLFCYFDGSCWPNPGGTAAFGFVIQSDGETIKTGRGVIGTAPNMTNNVAEVVACAELIKCVLADFPLAEQVWINGDSNIVIRQMNAKGKKNAQGHYVPYLKETHRLALQLRARCFVNFQWVRREQNSQADALADYRNFEH